MQTPDRAEFIRVLNGLALMKPGAAKLTPEALDLWWAAMSSWTLAEFKAGATHLALAVEFMPSPFHFARLRKAAELTPGEAWTAALAMCLNWRIVQPESRVLRAARAVGGLQRIAHADKDRDLPFIEKAFKTAYEHLADVEPTRAALPNLDTGEAKTMKSIMDKIDGEKPRGAADDVRALDSKPRPLLHVLA